MQEILSFQPKHLLGEGGFAEVWYAESAIGKRAAIKLLKPHLSQESGLRERFEQEARIMAQLEHPGIRQVYGYEAERLAMVMEYLEGEDLLQIATRQGPQSWATVSHWLAQTLEALAYAHARKVIHRDIKPSNLFLTTDGRVKVLDFGIARVTADFGVKSSTSFRAGTPMYMSPEQIISPRDIDARSDLYALGITAYYLLSGKPPYDDSSGSEFLLQSQIVSQPVPALPTLPDAANAWIATATQKKPEARFADARAAAVALPETGKEAVAAPYTGATQVQVRGAAPSVRSAPQPVSAPLPRSVNHKGVQIPLPEMVLVQGGTFWMGDDPSPRSANFRHEVTLDSFWIGKYPVTSAEYAAFLNAANPDERDRKKWVELESFWNTGFSIRKERTGFLPVRRKEQHPIVGVSWTGATAYTEWLAGLTGAKLRLPTEAEWEYAAGGGSQGRTMWAGTDDQQNLPDYAWVSQYGRGKTHPVGQKLPNGLGLYDMSGQVWEWCADWYGSDYYISSSSINPKGPISGDYRVARGGSWYDEPVNYRVACRSRNGPSDLGSGLGFRIAYR